MHLRIFTFLIFSLFVLTISSCSSSKSANSLKSNDSGLTVEDATATETRDGSTFERAIIVKSAKTEYNWIGEKYPGSQVESQALVRKNGKPYDILTFVTKEGETKVAYFDISKFFGKGF